MQIIEATLLTRLAARRARQSRSAGQEPSSETEARRAVGALAEPGGRGRLAGYNLAVTPAFRQAALTESSIPDRLFFPAFLPQLINLGVLRNSPASDWSSRATSAGYSPLTAVTAKQDKVKQSVVRSAFHFDH